jgi:hypothetical protein
MRNCGENALKKRRIFMIIINNVKDFEGTSLFADLFGISFRKFMTTKCPYTYFSEGVYDYYEQLVVFVLYKNEDYDYEYEVSKMETARIIEHKANSDSGDNYYETKKSIKEQLDEYNNYDGIIIYYSHSNSWNDDKITEKLYISRNNIEKIIKEEKKREKVKKIEKVAVNVKDSDDIRYLPEEDI